MASTGSPRTNSFFDTASTPTVSPATRYAAPSPLNLSRASSIRAPDRKASDEPLSPLHQSPITPSSSSWQPPLPPSEAIELRFNSDEAQLLGEGRYAQVYLAHFRRSNKGKERALDVEEGWTLCAAKQMNQDRESQTMGLREAFFLNRLKSPKEVYVVKLLAVKDHAVRRTATHGRSTSDLKSGSRPRSATDLSSFPSLPVLAQVSREPPALCRSILLLEHAPLGTLDNFLRCSPGAVGGELWSQWARQSCAAVAWVHEKGILHADVKPANLLLTATLDLRLSDFGSSLLVHPSHPPTDGIGLGTLPFSAPELVEASQTFSFPVDIFALGATLLQCITGKEPYRGLRSIEMMHHVRRGGLWEYEDRERFNQVVDMRGSPYPSAWREDPGVKRGGSLRLAPKPKLERNISEERSIWTRRLIQEKAILVEAREDLPMGTFVFLDGEEVPERVVNLLKGMLSSAAEDRPTASVLCNFW